MVTKDAVALCFFQLSLTCVSCILLPFSLRLSFQICFMRQVKLKIAHLKLGWVGLKKLRQDYTFDYS